MKEAEGGSDNNVLTHIIMRQNVTSKKKIKDNLKKDIQGTTLGKLLEETVGGLIVVETRSLKLKALLSTKLIGCCKKRTRQDRCWMENYSHHQTKGST